MENNVFFKLAGRNMDKCFECTEIIRPLKLVKLPNSPDYVLGICGGKYILLLI